jgi:hypothetical protein
VRRSEPDCDQFVVGMYWCDLCDAKQTNQERLCPTTGQEIDQNFIQDLTTMLFMPAGCPTVVHRSMAIIGANTEDGESFNVAQGRLDLFCRI